MKNLSQLCILLPKISGYRKSFDDTNYMFFLLKMNNYLKNIKKYEIESTNLFTKKNILNLK